jgi:hypothetical protein
MDTEQLFKQYQEGKRDFVWADLAGACLQGVTLAEANFNRAKFGSANLSGADLCQVNFFKADLSHADLTGAKLTGASFRKANLTGAKIELSQLPCTALRGAILPDGRLMQLEEDGEGAETLPCEAKAADLVVVATDQEAPDPGPEPVTWAQGLASHGVIEPDPEPVPWPRPQSWAEVWRVLPQKPLSLWILGYFLQGLTLYFSGAGGTAWVVSAIASLLWAIHESLSWFIPIFNWVCGPVRGADS